MNDLPTPRPADVAPDDLDQPFWEACRRHEFLVHRCDHCGRTYWPATSCIEHGGDAMTWTAASGRGDVHTFVVYHQAFHPAFADRVPYVLAVVQLEEGPFFHSDLLDCPPEQCTVGLPVEVVFEDLDEDVTIPHFRPRR